MLFDAVVKPLPAALLSMANVIDKPWNVCRTRAAAAGQELAECLLIRQRVKYTFLLKDGCYFPLETLTI